VIAIKKIIPEENPNCQGVIYRYFLKIAFFISFVFAFLFPSKVFAEENFKTYQKIKYKLLPGGNAKVSQEISLINLKPDIYVSEYTISYSGGQIINVNAWDKIGELKYNLDNQNSVSTVKLTFNEKVVGINQALSFIVNYEIPKFSEKEGNVWRIYLPKIDASNIPEEYNLEVNVPTSFGPLAFSSPYPQKTEDLVYSKNYFFGKKELLRNGALMEFGVSQTYEFELSYQLANNDDFSVLKEIALPPDTNYQSISYLSVDPNPNNVRRDQDGNWLAEYQIPSRSVLNIVAKGRVKIFPYPINILPKFDFNFQDYLVELPYWEISNQKLKESASVLKSSREIYQFVIDNLEYNYDGIQENRKRKGALSALETPLDSLCSEFTDLFVALSRIKGIPAREIEGYAFTDNPKLRPLSLVQDILHSWPEYFDSENNSWKMIDPTWGKTSGGFDYFQNFDMSHFTFAIHGLSSQYPYPAGSYHLPNNKNKNIFVKLSGETSEGQAIEAKESRIQASLEISPFQILSKKTDGYLVLKNNGPAAVYNLNLAISQKEKKENSELSIDLEKNNLTHLLPFATERIKFTATNQRPFFKEINNNFLVYVNNDPHEVNFRVKFLNEKTILIIGLFLIIISVIIVFFLLYLLRKLLRKRNKNDFYDNI